MSGHQCTLLEDGKRLHLHHGPIDLIVQAFGSQAEIQAAYQRAAHAFETVLSDLVEELVDLRKAFDNQEFNGAVAKRMAKAVAPHSALFVTPMAAVAGSVADHILEVMTLGGDLEKAYVNNGGDCALHLKEGQSLRVGAVSPHDLGRLEIHAGDPVRGIATSGWQGRSYSFGIADAVTVLAGSAAQADVAATLIANAVDLPGHPKIHRQAASDLSPDSDLGDRLVTVDVAPLSAQEASLALSRGLQVAEKMREKGHISEALLVLQGQVAETATTRKTVGKLVHA